MLDTGPTIETKVSPGPLGGAATDSEVAEAFGGFMQAFEAFKHANDERLDQLERRMSADAITTEKVERINTELDRHALRLDELALKAHRPPLGLEGKAGPRRSGEGREHKAAFNAYVRKGETAAVAALEAKGLSSLSDSDGGYLVPEETETQINRLLGGMSPLRAIASVRRVSAAVYKKPFAIGGAATGWTGETETRSQTTAPSLTELQFPAMELYAMPAATQSLLDDAAVSIDQWIAEEVQTAFAEQEADAFINGDGVNKPRGLLDYPTVADPAWSWGSVGYLTTGLAGGFSAQAPADRLIDMVYALKAGYRQNAHWLMNRKTLGEIRKLKDADGHYLWRPANDVRGRSTLLNFPVTEAEDMPDIADDATPLAFGDFARGYLIVDRLGVRILRDPYSAKPYVLFYTTKRVGGGLQNFEAIKLLKFTASWRSSPLKDNGHDDDADAPAARRACDARWRQGLSQNRPCDEGRVFGIHAVTDPDGRRRWLLCLCREQSA